MSIKSLPVLLAFSTLLYSEEVKELTALRGSWSQARQQAVKPVDSKYVTALTALKDRLVKSGNTKAAGQVEAELKKVSEQVGLSPDTTPKPEDQFAGDWEMRTSEGWTSPYKLLSNGTVWRPENGVSTRVATWSLSNDGKSLFLRYTSKYGAVDKFDLPLVDGMISGANDRKVILTLTKKGE
ncbi:MAG: hypothetical protein EOP85_06315 [Verrucomicrobiaceae bacterium]|nr:MAG: hypothetical protein EOP85_06315 [Verrucomicrobiaceae bacterium]